MWDQRGPVSGEGALAQGHFNGAVRLEGFGQRHVQDTITCTLLYSEFGPGVFGVTGGGAKVGDLDVTIERFRVHVP